MKNNRANLEVIAQNIEEAIEKGLADLGLPRDAVEITVLDEGGSGLLGFGSRQARVRISVLADDKEQVSEETTGEGSTPEPQPFTTEQEARLTEIVQNATSQGAEQGNDRGHRHGP